MVSRKKRLAVVIDTSVMVSSVLRSTASRKVHDLWWKEKKLQLVVSEPIVEEYLEVLAEFLSETLLYAFAQRFTRSDKVYKVQALKRYAVSRDPKDNMFVDAAMAGKAKYIISRDKDLTELKKFAGIKIVTPEAFLKEFYKK